MAVPGALLAPQKPHHTLWYNDAVGRYSLHASIHAKHVLLQLVLLTVYMQRASKEGKTVAQWQLAHTHTSTYAWLTAARKGKEK
jgi:hypothetical protein